MLHYVLFVSGFFFPFNIFVIFLHVCCIVVCSLFLCNILLHKYPPFPCLFTCFSSDGHLGIFLAWVCYKSCYNSWTSTRYISRNGDAGSWEIHKTSCSRHCLVPDCPMLHSHQQCMRVVFAPQF
jgi:hypothetical protein